MVHYIYSIYSISDLAAVATVPGNKSPALIMHCVKKNAFITPDSSLYLLILDSWDGGEDVFLYSHFITFFLSSS